MLAICHYTKLNSINHSATIYALPISLKLLGNDLSRASFFFPPPQTYYASVTIQ